MSTTSHPYPHLHPHPHSPLRHLETKLYNLHKCTNLSHIAQIHTQIYKQNLHQNSFIASKFISAYSLSRRIDLALNYFNQIHQPNVKVINTLIRGLNNNLRFNDAFNIFFNMQKGGILADSFTYPALLKTCMHATASRGSSSGSGTSGSGGCRLSRVRMIHAHVEKLGFGVDDIYVPNALLDSYCKCGGSGVEEALVLFKGMKDKDVVSWNTMVTGLVKCGMVKEGRELFDEMPVRDSMSWNTILDGYAKMGEMGKAFELFEEMPKRNVVSWSSMIGGYCKAGDLEMARVMFERMPVKNLVTWTIMIVGYAEKGLGDEAIELYDKVEEVGFELDTGFFVSVLSACTESWLLSLGKRVHASFMKSNLRYNTKVCNALIDMYCRCADLVKASDVFEEMVERDLLSWNIMLQGFAMHGYDEKALELFDRMNREDVLPDGVTFNGVLCACTHLGLVTRGQNYFSIMESDYGIVPQVEHYGCMIDLLRRSGHLKEAFVLINTMPIKPNAIIWGSLLGACRVHNDLELAEEVVNRLVEFDPSEAINYSILSNVYSTAGKWEEFVKVKLQMESTSVLKQCGNGSTESEDGILEFTGSCRSHSQSFRIYNVANRLRQHLMQVKHVPRAHY